jgi:hypothetical protein
MLGIRVYLEKGNCECLDISQGRFNSDVEQHTSEPLPSAIARAMQHYPLSGGSSELANTATGLLSVINKKTNVNKIK